MQQCPFSCPKTTELDMICPSFRDDTLPPLSGSIRPGCQDQAHLAHPLLQYLDHLCGRTAWIHLQLGEGTPIPSWDFLHLFFIQDALPLRLGLWLRELTPLAVEAGSVPYSLLPWSWTFPLSGHVRDSRGCLHRQTWWMLR